MHRCRSRVRFKLLPRVPLGETSRKEKLWGGRRRSWHLPRPYELMEVARGASQ